MEPKLDALLAVARQAVTGIDSTGSGSAASMLMYVVTDAVTDPERNRRGIAKVDMSAGHSGGGQSRDGAQCEMT
ncbi:hypothetical protein [Micromonospora coerulea]|uniref:hypothetical protein n=1 Tax=Micromonospora coerulea TaxID=47856 RepID=UPI00190416B5|nr:hypothetical protein [Micromonospora veneta]